MAKDKAVATSEIKETRNYDQFIVVRGNRHLDAAHVKRLMRNMLEKGNLTDKFPIVVNDKMQIIDGQHRFAALKELGWAVAYRVEPNLNLETVRSINQAGRNWTWKDYANSYADLDNDNYKKFLDLHSHFGYGYGILNAYTGLRNPDREAGAVSIFNLGEMKLPHYNEAFNKLVLYQEFAAEVEKPTATLAYSFLKIMDNPNYEHKHMMAKVKKFGGNIKVYANEAECLRALEELYNIHQPENTRVRLF